MVTERDIRQPITFGKATKPFDITGFIKRYGLLIVVIGSFLFTIAVPIVLLIGKPNYEVKALMRIDPVIPSLITKSDDPSIINYYQDYARTQAKRMMEFGVLRKTVESLTPDEKAAVLPVSLPADKCANILGFIIKVTPVSGTHLIEITAASQKKEGLAPLVNNFMNVFLEKVRNNTEMQDNERLAYLKSKKTALQTEISTIEEKLNLLTKETYTSTFTQEYNYTAKKIQEMQNIYAKSINERILAENDYKQTIFANEQLNKLPLDPLAAEIVMNDGSLDFTSSWTYQQLQQLRSTTDGLTTNNPDRIYVEQRMAAMKDYEKQLEKNLKNNAFKILQGKRNNDLQKELITAKHKLEKAKYTEAEIADSIKKSFDESIKISLGMHIGASLDAQLKHKRELLDRIDTRIHELEVEGKAPLRISIESMAREPDSAAGSNIRQLLILFAAVAFGSTGSIFLIYDFMDNRIRKAKDITNAFGFPPAATIPYTNENIVALQPFEAENPAAKTIRSFAITLKGEKERHNASVFLFTGVENGNGCSTLALNTAHALSALYEKVLLIQTARKPVNSTSADSHTSKTYGFYDLLVLKEPYKKAVTQIPNSSISVIHAGTITEGIIPQQSVKSIIAKTRFDYDIVCIDSSPVLESDITEHLASLSGIVVLVALSESSLYTNLRKAAELLMRLHVPVIAPVLSMGGIMRSLNIDKLLEMQPEFINRIDTKKIETLIRNLPKGEDLIIFIPKQLQKIGKKIISQSKKILKKTKLENPE
ncbi:AAA family ATPase [Chlorobium sp.]|uniref:AAA family ATPase n=1 Tax=Chlorobium sp. TaxID=1095 RepID=UPI0025C3D5E2|nr:AAA family ATPase [Chlorobium sp.]MCF8271903.1 AAA family ATPase [Chlorobium sp.]MCF8291872.1 AAA family ATPase [Chlorobium sp.]MCF8385992.1 AAA family ATPase [Chlorobium sp.]